MEEQKSSERDGRRDQKVLDGIYAQKVVVDAGPTYWDDLRKWGDAEGKLTPKEDGVLRAASLHTHRLPTELQSKKACEIAVLLGEEGCPLVLPKT